MISWLSLQELVYPALYPIRLLLALWLLENPVHPSQQLEGANFHLEVRDLDALVSWLIGLTNCRLLGPRPALDKLRARASAWLQEHS